MPWQPTVGSKPLAPFHHQVAGQSSMLRYDKTTVCKPLIARENYVYKTLPAELAQFTPEYRGEIEVQLQEEDGYIQLYGLCVGEDDACTCTSSAPVNQTSDKEEVQSKLLDQETRCKDDVQSKEVSREPSFKNRGVVRVLRSGSYEVNALTDEVFYDADSTSDHPHTHSLNPWSLKNHKRLLDKMRKSEHSHDKIRFILLKNVVADFRHPCILDLKIGSRLHGDEASSKKVASQSAKCQKTTSSSLGVRLCGMQVYQVKSSAYNSMDKFHGRTLDKDSFRQMLHDFLHNGVWFRSELIKPIVVRLGQLIECLQNLHSFRFYASSLLIIYDGDVTLTSREPEEKPALNPPGQNVNSKELVLPPTVAQNVAQELNGLQHKLVDVIQEQSMLEQQLRKEHPQASDELSGRKAVTSCQLLSDISSHGSLCPCDKSSQNKCLQSSTLLDSRQEFVAENQVDVSCIHVRLNEKNNTEIRLVSSDVLVSEKSRQSGNNVIVPESSQESSTGLSDVNQILPSQTPCPEEPHDHSSPGKTEHFSHSQENPETSCLNFPSNSQAALSLQPQIAHMLTDSVAGVEEHTAAKRYPTADGNIAAAATLQNSHSVADTQPASSGQVRAKGEAPRAAHLTSCWCSVLTDKTPASDQAVTPASGQAVTPASGQAVTPASDQAATPASGQAITPVSGQAVTPASGQAVTLASDQAVTPASGQAVTPASDQAATPASGQAITPVSGQAVTLASGQVATHASGQAVTPVSGQAVSTTMGPAVSPAHVSRHGSAKNGCSDPLLQGVSQVNLSLESNPAGLANSGQLGPEIHWGSLLSETDTRHDDSVKDLTNESLVTSLESKSQSSAQQSRQKLHESNTAALCYNQGDTKVDIKMIDFAHTTHDGFTEDKIKHTGPDEDYIHGLQNLKRLFQELLGSRN